MSTPDTMSEMEERLRAALTARAEQVRPEHLAPLAPVAQLRPRWQSPWVLLATAAVVLLVLGVVLQGLGGRPRSDDDRPRARRPARSCCPTTSAVTGRPTTSPRPRGWTSTATGTRRRSSSSPRGPRTSTAGSGCRPSLSGTGQEAYGIAELGTTIGTTALEPVDADGDGDQELVLLHELDPEVVGGLYAPVVFDLRDGLLVEAVPDDPDLLLRGTVPVPGSRTDHYEMVRSHEFWTEDGTLHSSRSVDAFASGNMTLLRPEAYVVDAYEWRLDEDGILRAGDATCLMMVPESPGAVRVGGRGGLRALPRQRRDRVRSGSGRGPTSARATGSVPASRPSPTRPWWWRGRTGARCATTASRSPTRRSPRCSPCQSSPTAPRSSSPRRPTRRTSRCWCRTWGSRIGCARWRPSERSTSSTRARCGRG